MAGGDPPDVFQANGGYDTTQWVNGDQIIALDEVFEKNNWHDILPRRSFR